MASTALCIAASALLYPGFLPRLDRGDAALSVRMDVKALIVDPIANMPVVILRDAEEKNFLPIWVGVFEANAIALQMEGVTTPRPMTHDLLKNLITQIEGDVLRVVINNLKGNTFYAQIPPRSRKMRVVILRAADKKNFLPIWVGVFEANAIALQMEGNRIR